MEESLLKGKDGLLRKKSKPKRGLPQSPLPLLPSVSTPPGRDKEASHGQQCHDSAAPKTPKESPFYHVPLPLFDERQTFTYTKALSLGDRPIFQPLPERTSDPDMEPSVAIRFPPLRTGKCALAFKCSSLNVPFISRLPGTVGTRSKAIAFAYQLDLRPTLSEHSRAKEREEFNARRKEKYRWQRRRHNVRVLVA